MEKVILVDKLDNEIGTMEKQEAHIKGVLHRAFSVFVFNSKKELLLQKRANAKQLSTLMFKTTSLGRRASSNAHILFNTTHGP